MKNLLELSSQQKNIWNSEMFYSNTNINNIGGYLLINEPVSLDILEKSANIYIKTNEALRLHFDLKNGKPTQFITDFSPFKLPKVSVESISALKKLTTELVSKPFEVINSNLYSFTLFQLPDGRGGIVPVFHHLISDAWSCSLFITRFINIYVELSNIFANNYSLLTTHSGVSASTQKNINNFANLYNNFTISIFVSSFTKYFIAKKTNKTFVSATISIAIANLLFINILFILEIIPIIITAKSNNIIMASSFCTPECSIIKKIYIAEIHAIISSK